MKDETICAKYIVLLFGVLELIAGLGGIGTGSVLAATATNYQTLRTPNYDYERNELTTSILAKFFGVGLVIIGFFGLINGFIAIIGSYKKNTPLLAIHVVLLVLSFSGALYCIFVTLSYASFVLIAIISIRFLFAMILIDCLRQEKAEIKAIEYQNMMRVKRTIQPIFPTT